MQRTNFPFEVIVGEDCSTDRTREIVLAYQAQYPDKIRAITSEKNVGGPQNMLLVSQACRGKYHAFCEGDDYWIDPQKLQKQVDFLEAHPQASMCFHNAFFLKENDSTVHLFFPSKRKEIWGFDDICESVIHLASIMTRSEVLAGLPLWRLRVWNGDLVLRLWCAHCGDIGYLDEIMSVYRSHASGMVAAMKKQREKKYADKLFVYREFDKETGYQHSDILRARIRQVEEKLQRERTGSLYFLLHPKKSIARLMEYRRNWKVYKPYIMSIIGQHENR
jgi:glycosyltransferase involved in cell wall biosynthesis